MRTLSLFLPPFPPPLFRSRLPLKATFLRLILTRGKTHFPSLSFPFEDVFPPVAVIVQISTLPLCSLDWSAGATLVRKTFLFPSVHRGNGR